MLYVMCLCILVSLRIPRYDLVKQTFISDVVLSHIYHNVYLSTETIGVAATPMIQATATVTHFNTYMTSSALGAPYIEGVDQHATTTVRQLRFDGVPNNENI
jgi:hypothetical protein